MAVKREYLDPLMGLAEAFTVRRRLAVALTEADLLRSHLRVSERLARERERLHRQVPEKGRQYAS